MKKQLRNTIFFSCMLLLGYSVAANAQTTDITKLGGFITTSFIPNDNAAERAGNLIDNNSSTKMYAGNGAGGTITFRANQPEVVTAYSIVSANDYPERDMAGWLFQGSVDGTTNGWVTLDTRSKETFPDRFQKRTFNITNSTAYKYYRWTNIYRNGNPSGTGTTSGNLQLADVELLAASSTGLINIMIGGDTYDKWATAKGAEGPEKATDSYIYTPSTSNTAAASGGGSRYVVANNTTWLLYAGKIKTQATAYSITCGNGANSATSDPKGWTVYGSNDSLNWVALDAQKDQAFSARGETKYYTLTNTAFYKYYKLDVTANNGGSSIVITDWQMDGKAGVIPSMPTGVNFSASTNNSLTLSWTDASSNEDGFVIEQSKDQSNWYRIINVPANTTSYTVTDLAQNVRYYFRMAALNNDFGKSAYTEVISKKTVRDGGQTYANIPEYPGILDETYDKNDGEGRYSLLDNNINTKFSDGNAPPIWIRWYASYPAAVDKYTITSANDTHFGDPQNWTFEGTNDTTKGWTTLDQRVSETFTNRFQKKTYTFSNSTRYSYYRLNVSSCTIPSIQMADMEIWGYSNGEGGMMKPTNLTAEVLTTAVDKVKLTWADNTTEETNYIVEHSSDGNTWTTTVTLDKNTTVYILSGLKASTKYYLRVSAINADDKASSNVVEITTGNPSISAPTEGYGDGFSMTSTVVSWTDNSLGEDGYELDRCSNSSFTSGVTVFNLPENTTSYIDTGLAVNTTYYYQVRALSALYNNSLFLTPISATTYKDLSGMVLCDTLAGTTAVALLDGNGGEGVENIIDGNPDTKYNTAESSDPPMWVQINFKNYSAAVTTYSIVSAADVAGAARDPYEWMLEGSNDGGNTWHTLHDLSYTPQKFLARKQEKQYSFPNTDKYSSYRLYINAINTSGSYYLQFADLKLYAEKADVVTDVKANNNIAPKVFSLSQNYPNPFNPSTNLKFTVEKTGHAVLKIYNILGAEVATLFNGQAEAGKYYQVTFNANKLASGVYIARVESGARQITKKLLLMK